MKKRLLILSALFAFSSFGFIPSLHATQFRVANAELLSKSARTPGSMAFKGKVEKVVDKESVREVTFKIDEALRGDVKTGEHLTLHFPDTSKTARTLRFGILIKPPTFTQNEEVVVFATTNIRGEHFLIGGDQSLFRVSTTDGKEIISNSLNNSNLVNNATESQNQKIRKEMVAQGSSGAISYEAFKEILDESDPQSH